MIVLWVDTQILLIRLTKGWSWIEQWIILNNLPNLETSFIARSFENFPLMNYSIWILLHPTAVHWMSKEHQKTITITLTHKPDEIFLHFANLNLKSLPHHKRLQSHNSAHFSTQQTFFFLLSLSFPSRQRSFAPLTSPSEQCGRTFYMLDFTSKVKSLLCSQGSVHPLRFHRLFFLYLTKMRTWRGCEGKLARSSSAIYESRNLSMNMAAKRNFSFCLPLHRANTECDTFTIKSETRKIHYK